MRGAKLLDRWLSSNVGNVAEWSRGLDLDPSYVCHLRHGRRTPSIPVAARIERATRREVPVQAWV